MKLRTSPSGPFFRGSPGDSLVCDGGDEWSVVSGVGTVVQSQLGNITFALLPLSAVPVHVPNSGILSFGATLANDKLRLSFNAAIVNSPLTPVSFGLVTFLQVSLDSGVTWKMPTDPGSGGLADTGAVGLVRIAALDPLTLNIVASVEVQLGAAHPAGVLARLAYISSGDCFINGAVAPGGVSQLVGEVVRGGAATTIILPP